MLSVAPKTDPTNESGEKTTPAPETKPKPLDLKNDSDFGASGTGVFLGNGVDVVDVVVDSWDETQHEQYIR